MMPIAKFLLLCLTTRAIASSESLVQDDSQQRLDQLIRQLKEESGDTKVRAARELSRGGFEYSAFPILPDLATALRTEDEEIRKEITQAIVRILSGARNRQLGEALSPEQTNEFIAEVFTQSLVKSDLNADSYLRYVLTLVANDSEPFLLTVARSLAETESRRLAAISLLMEHAFDDESVSPTLVDIANNRHELETIRGAAFESLGSKSATLQSLQALSAGLKDRSVFVRHACAESFGKFSWYRSPFSEEIIIALLSAIDQDENDDVGKSVATSLAAYGNQVVTRLVERLKAKERSIYRACHALKTIGPEAHPAIPAILKLLNNPYVNEAAVEALTEVGKGDPVAVARGIPTLSKLAKERYIGDPSAKCLSSIFESLSRMQNDAEDDRFDLSLVETPDLKTIIADLANAELVLRHSPYFRDDSALTLARQHLLSEFNIRTATEPVWWVIGTGAAVLIMVIIGIAVSTELYHRLLFPLGFHWDFADVNAQSVVFLRVDGEAHARLRGACEPADRIVSIPPDAQEFAGLRQAFRDHAASNGADPYFVLMHVDKPLLRFHWNRCLSDPWTAPDGLIYSGIIGDGADEARRVRAQRRGPLVVTALSFQSRGHDPYIPLLDQLVKRTAENFQGSGFRVIERVSVSDRDELAKACENSDVVIVAAHAQAGTFRLGNDDFTARDWRALQQIRCRLMLVLGCQLGDLAAAPESLLYEVVNSGVTCVASVLERQDAIIGLEFLPRFCREWRSGRGEGPTLAAALHRAALGVVHYDDTSREHVRNDNLNAYVILGTPALRLQWRWGGRRIRE